MKKLIDNLHYVDIENPYIILLISILFAYILFLVTNQIILRSIAKIFRKTSTKFDDILLEQKVFNKLPYLIPLIFLYSLRDVVPFFKSLIALINAFREIRIINAIKAIRNLSTDLKKGTTSLRL